MTAYNLSVVLLIPAAHRDAINAYAESRGWGPDNLSIELSGAGGAVWYGCHTWAAPEFLAELASPPSGGGYEAALADLVTSVVPDGDPRANWASTLSEYGLTQPQAEVRP